MQKITIGNRRIRMRGAKEYAGLFKTGQHGRLYITSGAHARGATFRIQVLPEGEEAISNGSGNCCTNADAVTVYGMISGQRGWTESYGWKVKGKWVDDFMAMVETARELIVKSNADRDEWLKKKEIKAHDERQRLLSDY